MLQNRRSLHFGRDDRVGNLKFLQESEDLWGSFDCVQDDSVKLLFQLLRDVYILRMKTDWLQAQDIVGLKELFAPFLGM